MIKGFFILLFAVFSQSVYSKDYIPAQAFQYKEIIKSELDLYFKELPDYNYIPSLIEHESCISLKHSKCWNPKSRLKTKWENNNDREEGAGFGQVTRTWKKDGSTRFDSLSDMKRLYKSELGELSWGNVYQKPNLQIRMMTLMLRDEYKKLYSVTNETERLKMVDSIYNGGRGDLIKSRRVCGLAKGCDPQIWFDHVEKYNVKSNKVLYSDRSPKMINNHHVHDVFHNNLPKYQREYFVRKGTQ